MATYKEIVDYTKQKYGFVAQTCWIAHIKSEHGLTRRIAANRIALSARAKPCPEHKRDKLEQAMRELSVI